jgi:glutamine amidotransferase
LIGRNKFLLADPDGTFEINDAPYGVEWDGQ